MGCLTALGFSFFLVVLRGSNLYTPSAHVKKSLLSNSFGIGSSIKGSQSSMAGSTTIYSGILGILPRRTFPGRGARFHISKSKDRSHHGSEIFLLFKHSVHRGCNTHRIIYLKDVSLWLWLLDRSSCGLQI